MFRHPLHRVETEGPTRKSRVVALLAASAAGVMMVAGAGFSSIPAKTAAPVSAPAAVSQAPDIVLKSEAPTAKVVPLKKAKPAPAVQKATLSWSRSYGISRSALAMLGWRQDCVLMAARAIYWNTGRWIQVWPWQYYWYGYAVSYAQARPGDLVYYRNGGGGLAHIAVYVGNGRAVHGGWNGYTTVLYSVWIGSGPNFIRLR
jgi:peptidoglycan DL-endopeptidase CwlO